MDIPSVKKTVILDFDGTLADTFTRGLKIANDLADEFGFRRIEEKDLPHLRNSTAREVMSYLGIYMAQVPLILAKGRMKLYRYIEEIRPHKGWDALLPELKTFDVSLGIVTSNSESNVQTFLKYHQLEYFDFVVTGTSLFGKKRRLDKLLKTKKLEPSQVLYIGDETRDIEAAHKVGIPIASVCWGFNTREALERFKPEHLIESPSDILTILGFAKTPKTMVFTDLA